MKVFFVGQVDKRRGKHFVRFVSVTPVQIQNIVFLSEFLPFIFFESAEHGPILHMMPMQQNNPVILTAAFVHKYGSVAVDLLLKIVI